MLLVSKKFKAISCYYVVMNERPVIVAGGGLGGLGVALGLANKGKAVLVLEKAPQLGEIGAGIQLGPNAVHSLWMLLPMR